MFAGTFAARRFMVLPLVVLAGAVMVLAMPLLCVGSVAWAQLDAPRQSAFRLVGTIEGGPFTGAVIDDTKNPQAFYRLNEKLPDDSQIVKVQSDFVVLKWPDGTKTELYTTPGAGGGGGSQVAATGASQAALPRRVDPVPEVMPNRARPDHIRPNTYGAGGQDAAGKRPPRVDRQNPNQQGTQVQDPNARKNSARGRRGRTRGDD